MLSLKSNSVVAPCLPNGSAIIFSHSEKTGIGLSGRRNQYDSGIIHHVEDENIIYLARSGPPKLSVVYVESGGTES